MQKVLVAGATGYLGGYVARAFKEKGYWVRALARSRAKAQSLSTCTDDLYQGEITRPQTLSRVCDGIDVVFSSIGITRQKDRLTYRQVDFQGNMNLLEAAISAGVRKFLYVSIFGASRMEHLAIVKAHEDFAREPKASGMQYVIIRPTGYFSDIGEFLTMAKSGRVFLTGPGDNRMNPIHGADLAQVCVEAASGPQGEINAGGPQVLSYRDIALTAFSVLGKPPRIYCIPPWVARASASVVKAIRPDLGEKLAFFATAGVLELVAPCFGTHTVREYFESLLTA